jgi:hypothetical protein
MTKKISRDIEFAIRLAIDALRRDMEVREQPSPLPYDQGALDANNQPLRVNRSPEKHRRDMERAITILKAIKTGYYEGEW